MKSTSFFRIIVFVLPFVFLTSCTFVYFDQPQSAGGERLSSVPTEIQGQWVGSKDTVKVTSKGLTQISVAYDSLDNIESITETNYFLSDTVQLYKSGDLYVANLYNPEQGWEILVAKRSEEGAVTWYYPLSDPYFGKGGGLKIDRVERSKSVPQGDSSVVETFSNKSLKVVEGENINVIYYKGKMKPEKLPMIIQENNIYWMLLPDGTIYEEDYFEEGDY
jgi:hypothetical protein